MLRAYPFKREARPMIGVFLEHALNDTTKFSRIDVLRKLARHYGMTAEQAATAFSEAITNPRFSIRYSSSEARGAFISIRVLSHNGVSSLQVRRVYEALLDTRARSIDGLATELRMQPTYVEEALILLNRLNILVGRDVPPGVTVYQIVEGREPEFYGKHDNV